MTRVEAKSEGDQQLLDIQKEECVPKTEGRPPDPLGVVGGSSGTDPEVGDQEEP